MHLRLSQVAERGLIFVNLAALRRVNDSPGMYQQYGEHHPDTVQWGLATIR
jgi:hypothetical protein